MPAGVMHLLAKLSMAVLMITVPAVPSAGPLGDAVRPLRLDGEVVDLKVERERQSRIVYLKVRLKFTNTGEKPVILLLGTYREKKEWGVLNTTALRTLSDALDGKPFYIGPTGPANSKSMPKWKKFGAS